jgi:hypothetical protein
MVGDTDIKSTGFEYEMGLWGMLVKKAWIGDTGVGRPEPGKAHSPRVVGDMGDIWRMSRAGEARGLRHMGEGVEEGVSGGEIMPSWARAGCTAKSKREGWCCSCGADWATDWIIGLKKPPVRACVAAER